MKTWTLRIRLQDKEIFNQIKSGRKPVETRAATVRYEPIQAGDTLVFVCAKEKCSKLVVSKSHFSSVGALVKKIPFKKIMPGVKSATELKKAYSSFPAYEEKIKRGGLFAFHLK